MPKIKCLMLAEKFDNGKLYAKFQMDAIVPPVGTLCTIKWGSVRTSSQNSLYWLFLSWLIDHGGLKEHGHFSPQALHEDLKAYFIAEKIFDRGRFKVIDSEDPTTTDMTKSEFGEYMDKVDEFAKDFFKCDTSGFWQEYRGNYT
jgi:hypothetical protein